MAKSVFSLKPHPSLILLHGDYMGYVRKMKQSFPVMELYFKNQVIAAAFISINN